jgi:hypothetical protein
MSIRNTFKSGDWNLQCDVCAKQIKASEAKHRWDGFIVCPDCFEERHSLDFVRARQDKISVPFVRSETEYFLPELIGVYERFNSFYDDLDIDLNKILSDSVPSITDSISIHYEESFADTVNLPTEQLTLFYAESDAVDLLSVSETVAYTFAVPLG